MTVWFNTSNFPKTEVGSGKFRAPVQTLENLEMKKTLVAIAALAAATGAMAQSSVSLTGYFDRGYQVTNNTLYGSAKALSSAAGTTRIEIAGTEDLGSGLKAGFFVETDWADLGGFSSTSAVSSTNVNQSAAGNNTASGSVTANALDTRAAFANSENYIKLQAAQFGTLKVGTPNSTMFETVNTVGQAGFSTGVGSIYSTGFSIHSGVGTGGNASGSGGVPVFQTNVDANAGGPQGAGGNQGQRSIRIANSMNFETNSINGLVAKVGFAPKNDVGYQDTSGKAASATVGVTEYSLKYSKGPLNVAYASIKYDIGKADYSSIAGPMQQLGLNSMGLKTQTNTYLAVNYEIMPGVKAFAGHATSKASDTTVINSTANNYGAVYTTGNIDLMVNLAKVDDQTTLNADRKLTGLGANYNFSKTTRLYARYDNIHYNVNDGVNGINQKRTAVGLSTLF
jgi:predicted porin